MALQRVLPTRGLPKPPRKTRNPLAYFGEVFREVLERFWRGVWKLRTALGVVKYEVWRLRTALGVVKYEVWRLRKALGGLEAWEARGVEQSHEIIGWPSKNPLLGS